MKKSLTAVIERNRGGRVAVTIGIHFDAVFVDAALARVNTVVATGPKVLCNTISVIPPCLRYANDLEGCIVAIVLIIF